MWLRRLLFVFVGSAWLVISHPAAAGIAILQYHHIGDDTPRVTSVTVAELEAHLDYLVEQDFTVLSLTEAAAYLAEGKPLPARAAAITFDDGWLNVYTEGLELFKKYQLPFTIFVNPALMRETPHLYMSWDQLRELQKYGATIANHSNSHSHMTWRLEGESDCEWLARQRADVVEAQAEIEAELGEQPKLFAYPFGEYNPALEQMLLEEGYIAFGQHSGPWGKYSPPAAIPRFPASAQYSKLATLQTKLLSLPLPVIAVEPENMILEHETKRPHLQVSLKDQDDFMPGQMNCFFGSEVVQPLWAGLTFTLQAPKALPVGRSRINCTVPSQSKSGRFYWFSQPFVRPDANGRWPD
ncbi:polysaccharide deacetylase family protein [Pseudidiomarina sp.]|uniref:polysaccharide deacetylase family protein n=1 Tax=Pseudidiomarina sp. TaxID=2081707 RepID=UPI00299DAE08|nr:polysaccharide deacetylase family protein [Pseudidiomarina sp.]MDX1706328.1 polysaccharide deacetylase family protein [Pseudidiomarina sp.]